MTPAPHGVTEIESEGAGTQQTNNSLATSPCGLAVSLGEKCVLLARREEKHVAVFFFGIFFFVCVCVLESGFMASLTTANISQAPTHQADIK